MKEYIYEIEKALFYNDDERAIKLLNSDKFIPDLLVNLILRKMKHYQIMPRN